AGSARRSRPHALFGMAFRHLFPDPQRTLRLAIRTRWRSRLCSRCACGDARQPCSGAACSGVPQVAITAEERTSARSRCIAVKKSAHLGRGRKRLIIARLGAPPAKTAALPTDARKGAEQVAAQALMKPEVLHIQVVHTRM